MYMFHFQYVHVHFSFPACTGTLSKCVRRLTFQKKIKKVISYLTWERIIVPTLQRFGNAKFYLPRQATAARLYHLLCTPFSIAKVDEGAAVERVSTLVYFGSSTLTIAIALPRVLRLFYFSGRQI